MLASVLPDVLTIVSVIAALLGALLPALIATGTRHELKHPASAAEDSPVTRIRSVASVRMTDYTADASTRARVLRVLEAGSLLPEPSHSPPEDAPRGPTSGVDEQEGEG
jgi:hypothetical protein